MADETNLTNLANVEDDTPEPAEPAQSQAVVAVPEPPAATGSEDDGEDDNEIIQLPRIALKSVRQENRDLKEKVRQADNLAAQLAALQGQLQGYQQVTQQLRQPVAAPAAPKADPNALKFAQRLDLYRQDASGQAVPDVEKAQELLAIIEQVAEQKASQHLEPVKKRAAQEASARNYQWAISQKTPAGKPINKEVLTEMWRAFPEAATADPMIAQTLVYTATGADVWQQTPPVAAPPNAPVYTESIGGNPRTRPVMSSIETNVAKDRGVSEKQWTELTKGYKSGHTTVLED